MQRPVQVTFRHMPHSPELEACVREHAERLERFFEHITGIRVIVEAPHHHHREGNQFVVRVHVAVPRTELVADRDPGLDHAHEDVRVAIRDAFDAARRQLEDYVREMRGDVKHHRPPQHGWIVTLFDDYGFIETPDGREVYFHEHSLLDEPFARLQVGQEVQFEEEEGDEGPQAASVRVAGRHHQVLL